MIRILHVVSVMDVAGMESYIMNMYRQIDRSKIQFDFLVHRKRRGVFEDEIESLGGHVYHTSLLDDLNLFKYLKDLKKVFSGHTEYRIVHGHLGSTAFLYLGMAKLCGVPWRILHSHCRGRVNTVKGYIKDLIFYVSPAFANVAFACSNEAGRYQFKKRKFEVIPNGVDVTRFYYSEETRTTMRKELGLEDKFVVGHVGRFQIEKNHEYILKIFYQLKKRIPNATMVLVGDGPFRAQIEEKAKEMKIEDSILFTGIRKECATYYQAMDAFILPSLYEALPLTGIEAQCAALPCLFSETVSREVDLGNQAHFLPIGDMNVGEWVEELVRIHQSSKKREECIPNADHFDSAKSTRDMAARYEKMWESSK